MCCLTDALAEPCYTSESSIGNQAPAIRHSRQVSNRALPAKSRARLQKLKLIRNRRLARDQISGFSLTSDDEHDRSATILSLKTLSSAKSPAGPARNAAKLKATRRLEKRSALSRMPRPSQVVQHIDEGSASDFGLEEESRRAHRRRVAATVLGIQYLSSKGEQEPVPQWSLMRHGLEKYTRLMQPPKEDCFIRNPLTEPALLTRHYRGTLIAVQKLGEARKIRKKSKPQTSESDSGDCADCEFWDATSGSEFLSSKERDKPVKSLPKQVRKEEKKEDKVQPSKADLVRQVLAESKSDESDSSNSSNSSSFVGDEFNAQDAAYDNNWQETVHEPSVTTPKGEHVVMQPDEVQLQVDDPNANGPPERDFLVEIFEMIDRNPNALTEVPARSDAPTTDAEVTVGSKGNKDVKEKGKRSDAAPQKHVSQFDKEKEKGMVFCQTKPSAKRSRHVSQASRHTTGPERQKRKLDDSPVVIDLADDNENVNYGNATKMMEKMGFTGRLGAKEDGVKEPIRAPETAGRSGLGLGLYNPRGADDSMKSPNPMGGGGSGVTADVHTDELIDLSMDDLPGHSGTSQATHEQESASRSIEVEEGNAEEELDEEDEFETDHDDSHVDNGRRAILVDVDVLIKNSDKRREEAFRSLINDPAKTDRYGKVCVERVLVVEKKELCDADCIKEIARLAGLEKTAELYASLQQDLDDAFEQGEKVEVNFELIRMLQGYSDEVHFGLFYKGSEKRLKAEVGSVYDLVKGSNGVMNLPEAFVTAPQVTVRNGDEWPYSGTWQDLMCRVGVQATQGVILVGEGGTGMSCGFAAGVILGARTMTMVSDADGLKIRLRGQGEEKETMDLRLEEGENTLRWNKRNVFDEFLKERKKRGSRKRVMALYSADSLWYCGREELGPSDGFGVNVGRSMIRFFKLDRAEWVENENVVGLCRRDYRKMRDAGFPGVLEVDDVEDM